MATKKFEISKSESVRLLIQTCFENNVTQHAQIACVLANCQHETQNFLYSEEIDGREQAKLLGYRGGIEYFGRGYIHLTHIDNYEKADSKLGLGGRLTRDLDYATNPNIAVKTAVIGMRDGWFTGLGLKRWIDGDKGWITGDGLSYYYARQIVNGDFKTTSTSEIAKEWSLKLPSVINDIDGYSVLSVNLVDIREASVPDSIIEITVTENSSFSQKYTTNKEGVIPYIYAPLNSTLEFKIDNRTCINKLVMDKKLKSITLVDSNCNFNTDTKPHQIVSNTNDQKSSQSDKGNTTSSKVIETASSSQSKVDSVTFNIKLVEGDTGKPLPNTTYHLEYKNNIKPHKTDNSGVESGIKADISQSISVYLDDDGGKKQSIYSMAFPVTGDLNGQTKVLKVPAVTLQLKFVDKTKKPIPNYQFKTVYRGRTSEIRKANARGIATVKALAGQQLKIIHVTANKFTRNIVTDGATEWTYSTDKLIEDPSGTTSPTSNVPSSTNSPSKKPNNTSATDKGNVIRNDKITPKGPTQEVGLDKAKITIKFVDEVTNKPLSGLTYWTQSTKYGKNASITGSNGTRGRTHDSDVGISIAVIVNENGKEIKKGPIIANSDKNGIAYVYKAKKPEFEKDIITYNIYEDYQIIKYIPKNISPSNKQKYKYIYYEKNGKKHNICIVNWNTTKEKSKGEKRSSKPTHASILYDKKVNQGQTSRRVKYKNGDIAEYGVNNGEYFWRLFKALAGDVTLVRMPDSLKYNNGNVKISYTFSNTQRRYTSPGHLACFIGALATTGLAIQSTGSCFEEGTGFPSTSHNNGRSVDTIYLTNQDHEQKYITAMKNFGCHTQYRGHSKPKYKWTTPAAYHNSHLHSMFDEKRVIISRE